VIRLALLAVALAIAAGCGDQCKDNEARCNGNTITECGPPNDITGTRGFNEQGPDCGDSTCKDVALDGRRWAVCTTSGVLDPRCDGIEAVVCFDAHTKLDCAAGYSDETDCVGSCVSDDTGSYPVVFCSVDTAPDPICDTADAPVCEAGAVVTCFDHYVVDVIPCATACITNAANVGYCTDGGSCSGPDQATCAGSAALAGCMNGSSVAMTCNPGADCENYDVLGSTQAQCVPRDY